MIFVVLRLYLVHSLINSFGLNEREDMLLKILRLSYTRRTLNQSKILILSNYDSRIKYRLSNNLCI